MKPPSDYVSQNNMYNSLAQIRKEYSLQKLTRDSVQPDPLEQFHIWLNAAINARVNEPTAMTLATVGNNCSPSARIVLLKGISNAGLTFYTSYESRKGQQLQKNSHAAAVFFWPELERQVRFEGITEMLPSGESDDYFNSRPAGSQAGAWASRQSRIITSRSVLEDEMKRVTARFKNKPVPRPPYWGGYRLIPNCAEFWQGRPDRLHDRISYVLEAGNWEISRLSP